MRSFVLMGLVCAGLGTSACAAKMCEEFVRLFPGINAEGNCDFGLGAFGQGKICISANGKFKATGKTIVQNESGATVKIEDNAEVLACLDNDSWVEVGETVTRSLLKVSKSGKLKVLAKGTIAAAPT